MTASNRIEMTQDDTKVTDLSMDVDFEIQSPNADFIEALALLLHKAHGKVFLEEGKYNIRLLAVVTKEGEE